MISDLDESNSEDNSPAGAGGVSSDFGIHLNYDLRCSMITTGIKCTWGSQKFIIATNFKDLPFL